MHIYTAYSKDINPFKFNSNVIFLVKKIRYLTFCFWKSFVHTIYILKRIKTRPNGPSQMGLMDLYPWAKEKASPSLVWVHYKQNTTQNKDLIKIGPKRWEIPKGARLNEGFFYGGMTCPPCLGFFKQSPIRKELGLQGREANPHYYKSPNTLSH